MFTGFIAFKLDTKQTEYESAWTPVPNNIYSLVLGFPPSNVIIGHHINPFPQSTPTKPYPLQQPESKFHTKKTFHMAPKVVPTTSSSSCSKDSLKDDELCSELDEEAKLMVAQVLNDADAASVANVTNSGKVQPKQPTLLAGCCSMRLFIILLILILLIACSVFIWLASYIGSSQALNALSGDLISRVGEKVMTFMDSELSPYMKLTWSIADDFNNGIIGRIPSLKYLFSRYHIYNPFAVGIFFPLELYTYLISGTPPNEVLTFGYKPFNFTGVTVMFANSTDGSIIGVFNNDTRPFIITQQAYWTRSFELFNQLGVDGVFGEPYVVKDSGVCIYYTVKLFDPTLYAQGQKQVVGEGFVLVAERNDMVIGGSINTTALDGRSRLSLFSLTTKNAGPLMQDLKNKYGSLNDMPQTVEVNSLGIDYIIHKMEYSFQNIRWNVFLVVYKEDIARTTNMNTYISVGVAAGVIIIGILCSIVIGYIITHPLRYLEKQFMKIKTFDLEKVLFISSKFKEVDSIYGDLHEMVQWLNEFKSFLPENVFNQLRNFHSSSDNHEQKKQDHNSSSHNKDDTISSSAGATSASRMSSKKSSLHDHAAGPKGLFRLGLSQKQTSVVHIELHDFAKTHSASEITHTFAKIASGLSTLAKTLKADLQIHSVEEFQLSFTDEGESLGPNKKKTNVVALESALKISKVLDNIGKSNNKKSANHLKYSIGISSGLSNTGNLGTSNVRVYSIVGPVLSNARKMSQLGRALNCKILTDSVCSESQSQFVVRPVDRFQIEKCSTTSNGEEYQTCVKSVYEVIKENIVEKDEWMYELEQQKANQRFKDFQTAFSLFEAFENCHNNNTNLNSHSSPVSLNQVLEHLNQSQTILQEHLEKYPEDSLITNRLLRVLDPFIEEGKNPSSSTHSDSLGQSFMQSLMNYHSEISMSLKGVIHMGQPSQANMIVHDQTIC
ncbi:hypothetical protein C9374_012432 [Naegleria lovaniensis]|uniref:Guanylate cyclase domain-containing protein n=1 Tax=Naegleria lovaniensis TaxID=51637 RepID=A0AA88GWE3_NAELO|nr:uncharacterized protein C9374_012432 [Naegleria lovaniensis]KAG2392180.1 hypothetical protein C9374_012432 [Naegleria lovaniensis]